MGAQFLTSFLLIPSLPAGEGGTKCRMRSRSEPTFLAPNALHQTPHPACAEGGAIHLLPQGEKVRIGIHP